VLFTMLNGLRLHCILYEKFADVSVKTMPNDAEEEDNVYVEARSPGADDMVQAKVHGGDLQFILSPSS